MVCRVCGRTIANENANFCEYCGTATNVSREGGVNYSGYTGENAVNPSYREASERAGKDYWTGDNFSHEKNSSYERNSSYGGNSGYAKSSTGDPGLAGILNGTAGTAEAENSMSFSHWIIVMLLPLIPMIGMFAYLAVLLIWAFGRTATKTRRNWARATLLVTAVSFLMAIYMLQSVLGSGGMAELMNSMMGSGIS